MQPCTAGPRLRGEGRHAGALAGARGGRRLAADLGDVHAAPARVKAPAVVAAVQGPLLHAPLCEHTADSISSGL